MIVIDIDNPKSCWFCPCRNYDDFHGSSECSATDKWIDNPSEKPEWCPIVGEIPERHGDLIDRDALIPIKAFTAPIAGEESVKFARIDNASVVLAGTEEQG